MNYMNIVMINTIPHTVTESRSRMGGNIFYGMDYSGGSRECEFGGCVWQSADLLGDAVKNLIMVRCKVLGRSGLSI